MLAPRTVLSVGMSLLEKAFQCSMKADGNTVFGEGVCLPDLLSSKTFYNVLGCFQNSPWERSVYAQGFSEEVSVNFSGLTD
jgi:hypothetical protein